MGKAVFYSENSIMSPLVGAFAFQRESMMKKGRLKTADGVSKIRSVRFQTTFDVTKRLNVDNLPNPYGFVAEISAWSIFLLKKQLKEMNSFVKNQSTLVFQINV